MIITSERQAGIAWAQAWRERKRAEFDALYGAGCCPRCGAVEREKKA